MPFEPSPGAARDQMDELAETRCLFIHRMRTRANGIGGETIAAPGALVTRTAESPGPTA
jgi:hypothetical protein